MIAVTSGMFLTGFLGRQLVHGAKVQIFIAPDRIVIVGVEKAKEGHKR